SATSRGAPAAASQKRRCSMVGMGSSRRRPWRRGLLRNADALVQLTYACRTDVGMVRVGNEDSMYAEANPYRGVFMVADGMGGHAAGEVASAMAVQIVTRDIAPLSDITTATAPDALRDALQDANRAIAEVDKQGMGTTASVLILSRNRYLIGQVGDSRIYRVRNGHLEQLTKDHS